jgi:hypothetical protein
METDYRTIHFDLGVSGSYTGSNKVFGGVNSLLPVDSRVQSGKIHSLTVVFSGSTFNGNLDFVIHDSQPTPGRIGSTYTCSFSDLKSILAYIPLIGTSSLGSDFSTIGPHTHATVYNINVPFDSDTIYMTSIYQNTTGSTFPSGSVWATVGYELGSSRG